MGNYEKYKEMHREQNLDAFRTEEREKRLPGEDDALYKYDAGQLMDHYAERNAENSEEDFKIRTRKYFEDSELAMAKKDRYLETANDREALNAYSENYRNHRASKRRSSYMDASYAYERMSQEMDNAKNMEFANNYELYKQRELIMKHRIKAKEYTAKAASKNSTQEKYLKVRGRLSCYMLLKDQLDHFIDKEEDESIKRKLKKKLTSIEKNIETCKNDLKKDTPSVQDAWIEEWSLEGKREIESVGEQCARSNEIFRTNEKSVKLYNKINNLQNQAGKQNSGWPGHIFLTDKHGAPLNAAENKYAEINDRVVITEYGDEIDERIELENSGITRFRNYELPTAKDIRSNGVVAYFNKDIRGFYEMTKKALVYYEGKISDKTDPIGALFKRTPDLMSKLKYLRAVNDYLDYELRADYYIRYNEGKYEPDSDVKYKFYRDESGKLKRNEAYKSNERESKLLAEIEKTFAAYNKDITNAKAHFRKAEIESLDPVVVENKAVDEENIQNEVIRQDIVENLANQKEEDNKKDEEEIAREINEENEIQIDNEEEFGKLKENNQRFGKKGYLILEKCRKAKPVYNKELTTNLQLAKTLGLITDDIRSGVVEAFLFNVKLDENGQPLNAEEKIKAFKNKKWIKAWTYENEDVRKEFISEELPRLFKGFDFPAPLVNAKKPGEFEEWIDNIINTDLEGYLDMNRRLAALNKAYSTDDDVKSYINENPEFKMQLKLNTDLFKIVQTYLDRRYAIKVEADKDSGVSENKNAALLSASYGQAYTDYTKDYNDLKEYQNNSKFPKLSKEEAKEYETMRVGYPDFSLSSYHKFKDNRDASNMFNCEKYKKLYTKIRKKLKFNTAESFQRDFGAGMRPVNFNKKWKPITEQDKKNDKWNMDWLNAWAKINVKNPDYSEVEKMAAEELPKIFEMYPVPMFQKEELEDKDLFKDRMDAWCEKLIKDPYTFRLFLLKQLSMDNLERNHPKFREYHSKKPLVSAKSQLYAEISLYYKVYFAEHYGLDAHNNMKPVNKNTSQYTNGYQPLKDEINGNYLKETFAPSYNKYRSVKVQNVKSLPKDETLNFETLKNASNRFTEKSYEIYKGVIVNSKRKFNPKINEIFFKVFDKFGDRKSIIVDSTRSVFGMLRGVNYDDNWNPLTEEDAKREEWNIKWLNSWLEEDTKNRDELMKEYMDNYLFESINIPELTDEQIKDADKLTEVLNSFAEEWLFSKDQAKFNIGSFDLGYNFLNKESEEFRKYIKENPLIMAKQDFVSNLIQYSGFYSAKKYSFNSNESQLITYTEKKANSMDEEYDRVLDALKIRVLDSYQELKGLSKKS
ncbi:MAG: hypothetical protein K6F00_05855 [Lachnospiraceae bacterium]|nr:hypothetical protein [Lachnospiraceae bacterium]